MRIPIAPVLFAASLLAVAPLRDARAQTDAERVVLYDRAAGEADVVAFDESGAVSLDHTNTGWRTSWNNIVAGDFLGNGKSQILLYDRNAGEADVVGFDMSGAMNLDHTNSGWRRSWTTMLPL